LALFLRPFWGFLKSIVCIQLYSALVGSFDFLNGSDFIDLAWNDNFIGK